MVALAVNLVTISIPHMPDVERILSGSTYTLPGIEYILAAGTPEEGTRWREVQCHNEVRDAATG